jgi:hypothetical protein
MRKAKTKERASNKGKRHIPLPKALKIMQDYKKNNYNGKKTLLENGYTELTADKAAKTILTSARERVSESLQLDRATTTAEVSDTVDNLFAVIGMERSEVLGYFRDIIRQDLNYAVKLRALEPLLREVGVNWLDKQVDSTPSVVIKVSEAKNKDELAIDAVEVGAKDAETGTPDR